MLKQRTLQRVVKASGIGLHSGQKVLINFVPHHADGGIVFRRIDLNPPVDIRANAMLIQEAFMCSNLVQEDAKVGTIEHVMSAIAGPTRLGALTWAFTTPGSPGMRRALRRTQMRAEEVCRGQVGSLREGWVRET